MRILNGDAFVIGGIGCITADLLQGNDLADMKSHNAKYGCQTCNVPNDQYTNINYNYIKNVHFHQQIKKWFLEIARQNSKVRKKRLAAEYSLAKLGSFKMLK